MNEEEIDDYNEDAWVPATPIFLTTAESDLEMSDEERDARIASLDEDLAALAEMRAQAPDDVKEELARLDAEIWADWEKDLAAESQG